MSDQRHVRFSTLGELTKDELQLAIEVWLEDALKAPWASKETMKLAGILRLYMLNPNADGISMKMVEDFYQLSTDAARRALVLFTLYGMIEAHSIEANQLRVALRLSRLQTLRVLEARQRLAELSRASQCDVFAKPIKPAEKVWLPTSTANGPAPGVRIADHAEVNAAAVEVEHSCAAVDAAEAAPVDIEQRLEPLPLPLVAGQLHSQACEPQSVASQIGTQLANPGDAGASDTASSPVAPPGQIPSAHDPMEHMAAATGAAAPRIAVDELRETPASKDHQDVAAAPSDAVMRLARFRQAAEKCSQPVGPAGRGATAADSEFVCGIAPVAEQDRSGQATLARSLERLRRRV